MNHSCQLLARMNLNYELKDIKGYSDDIHKI